MIWDICVSGRKWGPGGLEVALEAPGVDRARAKSRLPRGGRLQKKNADCYGDGGLRKTSMVHADAAAAATAARLDSIRCPYKKPKNMTVTVGGGLLLRTPGNLEEAPC